MWRAMGAIKAICLLLVATNLTVKIHGLHNVTRQQFYCAAACQTEINSVNSYVGTIQQQQKSEDNKIMLRIQKLENQLRNTGDLQALNQHLNRFESALRGNISLVDNLVNYDMKIIYDNIHHDADLVKKDLNKRVQTVNTDINNIKKSLKEENTHAADHHEVQNVNATATKRLTDLEKGKVSTLTQDNHIWRSNFRSINSTIERIKRNNFCMCF